MIKLLVNAPSGQQEIIIVGEGGGYFDLARVLWDERTDGPLPAVTLGGMVRVGNTLIFDQVLFDQSSAPAPLTPEQIREQFKARRAAAVAAIVVTVEGLHFDGDETSQSRMARAIVAMESAGVEATDWVLTDNSVVSATVAQLRQALVLAGAEQTRLWVGA